MPFHYVFNTLFIYLYFEVWQNVYYKLVSFSTVRTIYMVIKILTYIKIYFTTKLYHL